MDDGRLPDDVEITVYRVVQQGLTNAIQHASAKKLRVELTWADSELTVVIADDGKGFDVERLERTPSPDHLGLVNLNDRVDGLGGICEIESDPAKGTTITARIPTEQLTSKSTTVQTSVFVLGSRRTSNGG